MTPIGYELYQRVNLKTNQTLFNLLSFLGSLIFVLTIGLGLMLVPQGDLSSIDFLLLIYIFLGLGLYVLFHEAIHVWMMKAFSKEKITVGFNWRHAFAGMKDAYFTRSQYALIALAPSIILGACVALAMMIFYDNLSIYAFLLFILAQNFAGSTGDYYVVYLLTQIKGPLFVQDDGLIMSYYILSNKTTK